MSRADMTAVHLVSKMAAHWASLLAAAKESTMATSLVACLAVRSDMNLAFYLESSLVAN